MAALPGFRSLRFRVFTARDVEGRVLVKGLAVALAADCSMEAARSRVVLEGLRGEESIVDLCRREGIAESLYGTWSKEFLDTGKKRPAGDTARAATTDEVRQLADGTRKRANPFSGFLSRYLIRDRYGRPGKGNDNRSVEGLVGYARRNFTAAVRDIGDIKRPR